MLKNNSQCALKSVLRIQIYAVKPIITEGYTINYKY